MAIALPRSDERIGLALAIAAHLALVALLVLQPAKHAVVVPPERMTVTISDDVGLTSTSPEPSAQAAPDQAPELGEAPPPPAPEPVVQPDTAPPPPPQPLARPNPPPRPSPLPRAPAPRPTPQPVVRPQPPAPAKRQARPQPPPTAKPTAKSPAKVAASQARPSPPARTSGASRIGADFLKGVAGGQSKSASTNPPAAKAGPAVQSALSSSISRQLKPHWVAPQGVDADKLVTILAWDLNRDGSLSGSPRVVRQDGITDSNKAQAARHAEQAIRAVRLAAPFQLPDQYYDAWKRVTSFRFDKRLSQ